MSAIGEQERYLRLRQCEWRGAQRYGNQWHE
jgi:hypothetical protein